VTRLFWTLIYGVYALFGGVGSLGRSRKPEIYSFVLATLFTLAWVFALATNLSANIALIPSALVPISIFAGLGVFFRHIRLRSADDPHFLARKKRLH